MKTITLLLIALLVSPVFAQKTKSKTPVKPKTAARKDYRPDSYYKEFSRDFENIPENLWSHQSMEILDKLEPLLKPKGEFETTEAYRQRIEAAVGAAKVLGDLSARSRFALFGRVTAQEAVYDADKKTLHIRFTLKTPVASGGPELDKNSVIYYVKLAERTVSRSQYIREFDFGLKRTVTKTLLDQKRLVIGISPRFDIRWDTVPFVGNFFNLDLTLDADKARRLKGNLGYIFSYKLVFPYTYYGTVDLFFPKIDQPYDITAKGHDLMGKVDGIWIYDTFSGEILWKKTID